LVDFGPDRKMVNDEEFLYVGGERMGLALFVLLVGLFLWWGRERRGFLRAPQPIRLAALARAVKGAVTDGRVVGQFAGREVIAGLARPLASEVAAAQESPGLLWESAIHLASAPSFQLHWAIDPGLGRRAPILTGADPARLAGLVRWAELEPLLADGETRLMGEGERLIVAEYLPGHGVPTPERLLAHLDLVDRAGALLEGK
jgi:hypothetical protein